MKSCYFATLLLCMLATLGNHLHAQGPIKAGPMVGHVEMMEAEIWLQTNQASKVQIYYWDTSQIKSEPAKPHKQLANGVGASEIVLTQKSTAFTAHIVLGRLEPGRVYQYAVYVDRKKVALPYQTRFKTPELWQWRKDPPELSVAFGSCNYVNDSIYDRPGKPYGSGYEIFRAIHQAQPQIMLWLGDNYYFREADWFSKTGMMYRASHSRSIPELQPLLASTHHYAVWDDHDFGPNDSDRSWHLKEEALDVFKMFWANPSYGIDQQKGVTTAFQYSDIDFFLLDNRYFRTANRCLACKDRDYFGKAQIDWLVEALANSFAPFKIVATGGLILNTKKAHENYINVNEAERAYLLKRIEEEKIKGVVFLTGDVHHGELNSLKNANGNTLLDITSSSLTAGTSKGDATGNTTLVDGTMVDQHNFGMLRFFGPRKKRNMEVSLRDRAGKVIWTKTFNENEL